MAKQESLELREASNQLRLATAQLRDFNQSAGVEIAKTVGNDLKKGVLDPFTQSFAQIPGVATLGSVGKTLFNKTFSAIKERREQNLLRQQLNLSKEEFKQLQLNKKVLDAQKAFGDKIDEASKNLLGYDPKEIQKAIEAGLDPNALNIQELIELQRVDIEDNQKRFDRGEAFKSREAAEQNRKERKEEERTNIFQDIAAGIKGLAKGAANATKATGGFLSKALDTLFLPLGVVGSIIGAFIGGFVKQIKNDFGPLFKTLGNMFRGLKLRISSVIAPPFRLLFGEKGPFGAFFKFLGETVGKVKTSFTTAKDGLSKNLFIRGIAKVGETIKGLAQGVFGIFSNVIGRLREAGAIAKNLPIIKTITQFAAGFGAVLGKLFLPITIVIGAFDLITGFIDGWTESEGNNIYSKFVDGVGGALSKLIGNLIGIPLDLLKKGVAFILGKMGFENAEETLNSFSFTDIIKKIVKAPFTLISTIANKIVDIFTNFSIKDSLNELKTYINELAPKFFKRLLRGILPAPDFLKFEIPTNRATEFFGIAGKGGDFNPIPKGVYQFAGINYDTGEIEGPKPSARDTVNLGRAGLQDEFFKARREGDIERMEELIREAEEQRQNNVVINQIYNQQDQRQSSSNNTIMNESITDVGGPPGAATAFGPS
tara:strand:+ start:56 stop:2020 length:1965 start_codon:yes stop_codon:yes gene_type:complete